MSAMHCKCIAEATVMTVLMVSPSFEQHCIPMVGHVCSDVIEKKKKTKQNKTKQNKTKQNKTKQNKTKQNKTKQNKTKQNKTKQKTTPFGVNLMRSQVLYWAAQQ